MQQLSAVPDVAHLVSHGFRPTLNPRRTNPYTWTPLPSIPSHKPYPNRSVGGTALGPTYHSKLGNPTFLFSVGLHFGKTSGHRHAPCLIYFRPQARLVRARCCTEASHLYGTHAGLFISAHPMGAVINRVFIYISGPRCGSCTSGASAEPPVGRQRTQRCLRRALPPRSRWGSQPGPRPAPSSQLCGAPAAAASEGLAPTIVVGPSDGLAPSEGLASSGGFALLRVQ